MNLFLGKIIFYGRLLSRRMTMCRTPYAELERSLADTRCNAAVYLGEADLPQLTLRPTGISLAERAARIKLM